MPDPGSCALLVFDEQGSIVLWLADEIEEAGQHSVLFVEMKFQKQPLAAGMNFSKM